MPIIELDRSELLPFRQRAEADVVIEFDTWDNISINKEASPSFTKIVEKDTFLKTIGRLHVRRRFAVVVMSKVWSISNDRVSLDDIETLLREAGFQRIVFQQARGWGVPILRDTAK